MTKHMPAHTRRWHAPKHRGEWWGDRLRALDLAAKDHNYIDQNFQVAKKRHLFGLLFGFTIFCLHWGNPFRDNYHYIVGKDGKTVRRMTKREVHRNIGSWNAADVYRWRRGPHLNSARPHTLAEHARRATKDGIQIIPELKSRLFRKQKVCAQGVATMKRHGQEPWAMALYTMKYPGKKCAAWIHAGGQFALIYGGRTGLMRETAPHAQKWKTPPTRIWG